MSGRRAVCANRIACLAAALLLLFLFLYPNAVLRHFIPDIKHAAQEGKNCILSRDWEGAEAAFSRAETLFLKKKAFLKICFDHEDVDELSVAFDTCAAMLAAEEPQALAELARIANIAQYLYEIETFRWYSFI